MKNLLNFFTETRFIGGEIYEIIQSRTDSNSSSLILLPFNPSKDTSVMINLPYYNKDIKRILLL